jgi:hypothetical protein
MTALDFNRLAMSVDAQKKRRFIRWRVEGTQGNALAFLKDLKTLQGDYRLAKLLLVPSDFSDYRAVRVKLVLDFLITIA